MTTTQEKPDVDTDALRKLAQDIIDSLRCAEDCETAKDLLAKERLAA